MSGFGRHLRASALHAVVGLALWLAIRGLRLLEALLTGEPEVSLRQPRLRRVLVFPVYRWVRQHLLTGSAVAHDVAPHLVSGDVEAVLRRTRLRGAGSEFRAGYLVRDSGSSSGARNT